MYLPEHRLCPAQRTGHVKGIGPDGVVYRVKLQGPVHLEPRNAEAHHGIGHGMAPGEHVLDLFAGIHEPGGDLPVLHGLLHLIRKALALSDPLHDLEGKGGVHTVGDQVVHDIVPGAENFVELGHPGDHQAFRIVQPYVRAVGQSGNTHQLLHGSGPGLLQYLLHKAGAELRHPQGAYGAFQPGKIHMQGLRRGIDLPGLRVVQGDAHRVDASQILQHT